MSVPFRSASSFISPREEREELIQWLDAYPDQWTVEFQEAAGRWLSLREALDNSEDN
jgi:hypothetical protein